MDLSLTFNLVTRSARIPSLFSKLSNPCPENGKLAHFEIHLCFENDISRLFIALERSWGEKYRSCRAKRYYVGTKGIFPLFCSLLWYRVWSLSLTEAITEQADESWKATYCFFFSCYRETWKSFPVGCLQNEKLSKCAFLFEEFVYDTSMLIYMGFYQNDSLQNCYIPQHREHIFV